MVNERHVYLALEAHRISEEGTKLNNLAVDSLLIYAHEKFIESGEDFTDEEVTDYTMQMITNHIINHMIDGDLVHENYDGTLELTEKGQKHADFAN